MVVDAPRGVETHEREIQRNLDAQAGVAIPGLPFDVVVTHVLREDNLPDPADIARIRVVSRGMRDAVDATGRRIAELGEDDAVSRGCSTKLRCLQRQGRLSRKENLCQAAARSGQFEELKALHAENCPWDEETCTGAVEGGHLEVLRWARANGYWWDASTRQRAGISMCCSGRSQTDARGAYAAEGGQLDVLQWARANGCPWDGSTCAGAAEGGHLDVLQWARANGCPWNETTCEYAVKGGKFELYKWARANGCTWIGRWRIWSAMQNGHHHLARWIKAIA